MLPVGNMDTWGGYATISFVKRATGMEVSQGIIAGWFLMRKGSFPRRPSAGGGTAAK